MQCPSCNSDNVQKLQLIYEGGTQKIDTTSYHSGGGYSARGGAMIGGGTSTTTGQAQSIAAKKAAPPAKKNYARAVALIAAAVFSFISGVGILQPTGVILLAVAAFLAYRAYSYNKGPWPELYSTWSRSWQCNKCGNTYTI